MTTKVTDQQVLAVIGDVPISNAEIGRRIGIDRSNVAPRVKRLEAAGLIKKVSGRWVRTDKAQGKHEQQTRLSKAQQALAEKMIIGASYADCEESEECFDILDKHIDGSNEMVMRILENLHEYYPENEMLEQLMCIAIDCVDCYDTHLLDASLVMLREIATGEKAKRCIVCGRSQAMQDFINDLLPEEGIEIDDGNNILYGIFENNIKTAPAMEILLNMRNMYPDDDVVGTIACMLWSRENSDADVKVWYDTLGKELGIEPNKHT